MPCVPCLPYGPGRPTVDILAPIFAASAGGRCAGGGAGRPGGPPPDRLPEVPARSEAAGLSLGRPYVRGKIPVVLIHGLGSSPRSWAHDDRGPRGRPDPPSELPVLDLRLSDGRASPLLGLGAATGPAPGPGGEYDPDGSDPAFDRMVPDRPQPRRPALAKVMAQDSRSHLWETVSAQPAERLDGPAEARELLRQAFLFKPLPEVRRIIFIATPHRGGHLDRGCRPRPRLATHPAWGSLAAGLRDPPGEQPARFLPQPLPGGTSHQRRPTDVGPSPAPGPSRCGARSGGEVSLDHRRPR